jgi:hypothetical protein
VCTRSAVLEYDVISNLWWYYILEGGVSPWIADAVCNVIVNCLHHTCAPTKNVHTTTKSPMLPPSKFLQNLSVFAQSGTDLDVVIEKNPIVLLCLQLCVEPRTFMTGKYFFLCINYACYCDERPICGKRANVCMSFMTVLWCVTYFVWPFLNKERPCFTGPWCQKMFCF